MWSWYRHRAIHFGCQWQYHVGKCNNQVCKRLNANRIIEHQLNNVRINQLNHRRDWFNSYRNQQRYGRGKSGRVRRRRYTAATVIA